MRSHKRRPGTVPLKPELWRGHSALLTPSHNPPCLLIIYVTASTHSTGVETPAERPEQTSDMRWNRKLIE